MTPHVTMSLKKTLKESKAALDRNDPEEALDYIKKAIEIDSECYFAYVFRGKAYQLMDNAASAAAAFKRATTIQPDDLLGWKGYLQVLSKLLDYPQYLEVFEQYVNVLLEQDKPTAPAVKDLYNYLHSHGMKGDKKLRLQYLRSVAPGLRLQELLGSAVGTPIKNLEELISAVKEDEKTKYQNQKRTISIGKKSQTTDEWSHRKDSELPLLYEALLNICDDDEKRRSTEEELFKFLYALLKVAPAAEKPALLERLSVLCSDMVVVGSPCVAAWNLLLDLQDPETIGAYDELLVFEYIQRFPEEGLSVMLYLYLMSDFGPFNRERLQELVQVEHTDGDPEDGEHSGLLPADIVLLMASGYSLAENSVLAQRLMSVYLVEVRDYGEAEKVCGLAVSHLAKLLKQYGIQPANAKQDCLCSLATVFTYHEAPKNFTRALLLYAHILEKSPDNKQALLGKGRILLEQGSLDKARRVLELLVEKHPLDTAALLELGWCETRMQAFDKGIERLSEALKTIEGTSAALFEQRATAKCKLAQTYLQRSADPDSVDTARRLLEEALEDCSTHAPAYTELGMVYEDHVGAVGSAQKCYFKAFELDPGELVAARRLVAGLALQKEWEVAEVLCKRVVLTERSRRLLLSSVYDEPDRLWPYRVLGCAALNAQDDAKAVEWFQTALRTRASDTDAWIGLGEAYYNSGRVEAAIKVFAHARKSSDSWLVHYMLGLSLCEIGNFTDGTAALQAAHAASKQACVVAALYELCVAHAASLHKLGLLGRALHTNRQALAWIAQAAQRSRHSQKLWRALIDGLALFAAAPLENDQLDVLQLLGVFGDLPVGDDRFSVASAKAGDTVAVAAVLAARAAVHVLPKKASRYMRSVAHYNLGLAYLRCGERGLAVESLKTAISCELGNGLFWNALGVAYADNAAVAQHCFIKASAHDAHDGTAWSNLGALYLKHGDAVVAHEAFQRAVATAPEQPLPWLGSAFSVLNASALHNQSSLLTHAYVLSKTELPLAKLCYARDVVARRVGHGFDTLDIEAAQEVSIAHFAIQGFLKEQPSHQQALALALALSERCQTASITLDVGHRILELLAGSGAKTAHVRALMARAYLAQKDYDAAVEYADAAGDVDDTRLHMSVRITVGLALFFSGRYTEALEELQGVLERGLARGVVLVAQVLFALGEPETKQAAIDELFAHIEEHGAQLAAVLTLGAISVVEDLSEYHEAIKEELESLPLAALQGDTLRAVPRLLAELAARLQLGDAVWQRFALLFPHDYRVWRHLSRDGALEAAQLSASKLTAGEIAEAYFEKGTVRHVQRSLLMDAQNSAAREALAQMVG